MPRFSRNEVRLHSKIGVLNILVAERTHLQCICKVTQGKAWVNNVVYVRRINLLEVFLELGPDELRCRRGESYELIYR